MLKILLTVSKCRERKAWLLTNARLPFGKWSLSGCTTPINELPAATGGLQGQYLRVISDGRPTSFDSSDIALDKLESESMTGRFRRGWMFGSFQVLA